MKKLFILALLGTVLVSCKKTSSGSTQSIQATIGGTATNFNVLASGTSTDSGTTIELIALNGTNQATAYAFDIIINSNNAITKGTYSDINSNTQFNYGPFVTSSLPSYSSAFLVSDPITVVVTSISNTNIQGTFHGDIYLYADSTQAKKTVTNGTFNVNLKQE
jgi:hypothetical protein